MKVKVNKLLPDEPLPDDPLLNELLPDELVLFNHDKMSQAAL